MTDEEKRSEAIKDASLSALNILVDRAPDPTMHASDVLAVSMVLINYAAAYAPAGREAFLIQLGADLPSLPQCFPAFTPGGT
jgi:hypothetical protein